MRVKFSSLREAGEVARSGGGGLVACGKFGNKRPYALRRDSGLGRALVMAMHHTKRVLSKLYVYSVVV